MSASAASVRLSIGQALERWPDMVFSPLGGRMSHAIEWRVDPSLLCQSLCGFIGFAPAAEFEIDAGDPACLRCTRILEERETSGKKDTA